MIYPRPAKENGHYNWKSSSSWPAESETQPQFATSSQEYGIQNNWRLYIVEADQQVLKSAKSLNIWYMKQTSLYDHSNAKLPTPSTLLLSVKPTIRGVLPADPTSQNWRPSTGTPSHRSSHCTSAAYERIGKTQDEKKKN